MAIKFLNAINVDSGVLYTDVVNNRVGIGTTSPGAKFVVSDDSTTIASSITNSNSGGSGLQITAASGTNNILQLRNYLGGEVMRVRGDGNVGIGTTNPGGYKLRVEGDMSLAGNKMLDFGSGNARIVNSIYSLKFQNWDGSTVADHMTILGSGNVGIGTTSPGYKLNVINDNTATWTARFTNNTNNVYLSVNDTNNYGIYVSGETKNYFSGNVGIGTTSPGTYKLNVAGTSYFGDNILLNNAVDGTEYITYNIANSAVNSSNKGGFQINEGGATQVTLDYVRDGSGLAKLFTTGTNRLTFGTNSIERMRISEGGNVGIGTTSPGYKLTVDGDVDVNNGAILAAQAYGVNLGVSGYDILMPTTTRIAIKTSASERVSILNTGNVGIGTTSPGYKLDVSGTLNTSGAATFASSGIFGGAVQAGGSLTVRGSAPFITFKNSAGTPLGTIQHNESNLLIDPAVGITNIIGDLSVTGNVGIGVTSPNQRLQVQTATTTDNSFQGINVHNNGTTGTRAGICFQGYDWVQSAIWHGRGMTPTSESGALVLGTNPNTTDLTVSGVVARMVINNAGAIKFNAYDSTNNTGTPTYLLGTDASGNIVKTNTVPGSAAGPYLPLAGGTLTGPGNLTVNGTTQLDHGGTTHKTIFGSGNEINTFLTDGSATTMRITDITVVFGGQVNVGIGTTSPAGNAKLDIDSTMPQLLLRNSAGTNSQLLFEDNSGSTQSASITFSQAGQNALYITTNYDSPTDGNKIFLQPGGETAMTLIGGNNSTGNAGNVGIGTTSPTHKLDVSGTGRFTSTVTATNFILSSDERKKTKIKDLSRDNIDISWKSFEMKSDEGEYRVGVIAQELEIKHPEFVNTDNEGFKSVKYIDLLISKIAELEARLEKAGI
jgi:hypothetical protein